MRLNVGRGIYLPYDPEDLEGMLYQPKPYGIWYVCPLCKNRYQSNLAGVEPCCTGPNSQWDEHPMTPMEKVPE